MQQDAARARSAAAPSTFNVKPSRVGRLRDLFALYDACESRGFDMYGGGIGELGVARGQIQLLAAMFSPDGPNDIAPPGFNALIPRRDYPRARWTRTPRPPASAVGRTPSVASVFVVCGS